MTAKVLYFGLHRKLLLLSHRYLEHFLFLLDADSGPLYNLKWSSFVTRGSIWKVEVVVDVFLTVPVHLSSSTCACLSSGSFYSHAKGNCTASLTANKAFWFGQWEQNANFVDIMQVKMQSLCGSHCNSPSMVLLGKYLIGDLWPYFLTFELYHMVECSALL